MLLTALALQGAELGLWAGLYYKTKHVLTQNILIHGRRQATKLPIIDGQLKKYAGSPTSTTKIIAQRMVTFARKAVNTKAFEHVVTGMANSQSPMRKRLVKKTPLIIL